MFVWPAGIPDTGAIPCDFEVLVVRTVDRNTSHKTKLTNFSKKCRTTLFV